jgi:tetratricopeptide (TPR) repeat protein
MTRAALRVSIFALLSVAPLMAVDDKTWNQDFESGNKALQDGDYLRARQCYASALQLTEPLGRNHPSRALILAAQGSLESSVGNDRQAEALFFEAREILERNNLRAVPQYAQILGDLGVVCTGQGRWMEAEQLLKQAQSAFPPGSLNRAAVTTRLGSLYSTIGRMTESLALFQEASDIEKQALPASLQAYLSTLDALGASWLAQGRYQQADSTLREAWRLSQQLPPAHPLRAESASYLGSTLFLEGKPERATPLLKVALSIYERSPEGQSCQSGPVLTILARVDASERHYALAEEKLQRVLDTFRKCFALNHVAFGYAQANLAQLYIDQQKYQQARPLLEDALNIIRSTYTDMDPRLAAIVYEQARLESGLGDREHAETHFRESIGSYEKSVDPHDPRLGAMLHTYAAFLKKEHRKSEAAPIEARAKSIFAFQPH